MKAIYNDIRVHAGPCGPIFAARGEKKQVKKVKINISDRDFFLGLFQEDPVTETTTPPKNRKYKYKNIEIQ